MFVKAATELTCQGQRSERTTEANTTFDFSKMRAERFCLGRHAQPCVPEVKPRV